MNDAAHDHEHVYRVLHTAVHIAGLEDNVDCDVLIAACLLHDIGRKAQFENPSLCHAEVGGVMAYDFLIDCGWRCENALHVKDCITTHRFRSDTPPLSIEAKILFDSDKLDVTGALGIARTLIYQGQVGEPIYTKTIDGEICLGLEKNDPESFFREFNRKLKRVYDLFYTAEGRRLAELRKATAYAFYSSLMEEVGYTNGLKDT